jgi:hypothetical protein
VAANEAIATMLVINAIGLALAYLITRKAAAHRRELALAELEMIHELRLTMHDLKYSSPEIEESLDVGLLELAQTESWIRRIAERPLWRL